MLLFFGGFTVLLLVGEVAHFGAFFPIIFYIETERRFSIETIKLRRQGAERKKLGSSTPWNYPSKWKVKEEAKQKKMEHRNLESLVEHKAAHIKYDIP